jgi:hypothetical protein
LLSLSQPVHELFKVCLSISDKSIELAWAAVTLHKLAWNFEVIEAEQSALQRRKAVLCRLHLFILNWLTCIVSTGMFNITPPARVYNDPQCHQQLLANENDEDCDHELAAPSSHVVSIFT